MIHPRAAELLGMLSMRRHPEGGHYAETHRSSARVRPQDHRVERSALTQIFFLLTEGEYSRWHRVLSDEVWHFYEGDALELLRFDAQGLHRIRLGPVGNNQRPVGIIPGGSWQAARTLGAYTLVGCTVGPGFDFDDFALAIDFPDVAERIRNTGPDLARFI